MSVNVIFTRRRFGERLFRTQTEGARHKIFTHPDRPAVLRR